MKKWFISASSLVNMGVDPFLLKENDMLETKRAVDQWLYDECPGVMPRLAGALLGALSLYLNSAVGTALTALSGPESLFGKAFAKLGIKKGAKALSAQEAIKIQRAVESSSFTQALSYERRNLAGHLQALSPNALPPAVGGALGEGAQQVADKVLVKSAASGALSYFDKGWLVTGVLFDFVESAESTAQVWARKVPAPELWDKAIPLAKTINPFLSALFTPEQGVSVDDRAIRQLLRGDAAEARSMTLKFDDLVVIYFLVTCAKRYYEEKNPTQSKQARERISALEGMEITLAHAIAVMGMASIEQIGFNRTLDSVAGLTTTLGVPAPVAEAYSLLLRCSAPVRDTFNQLGFESSEALQSFGTIVAGGLGAKVLKTLPMFPSIARRLGVVVGRSALVVLDATDDSSSSSEGPLSFASSTVGTAWHYFKSFFIGD